MSLLELINEKVLRHLGLQLLLGARVEFDDGFYQGKYIELIKDVEWIYSNFLFDTKIQSDDFQRQLLSELQGTDVTEAMYIVCSLNEVNAIQGDICEFGVAHGATSALISHIIKDSKKNLWLFDSFLGLPKPTNEDILIDDVSNLGSIEAYEGHFSYTQDSVISRLVNTQFPMDRVKIVPGFIEEVIGKVDLPKISFAFIDFDFYGPIKTALEFVDDNMCPGGIIIVDDYDFFSAGAKKAVDEFLEDNTSKYSFIQPKFSPRHFCILKRNLEIKS